MAAKEKESFEEAKFMKELVHLRDTQEAIQSLSAWCLKNKKSAYKIARCWLKVIKKGNNFKISIFDFGIMFNRLRYLVLFPCIFVDLLKS